MADRRRLGLWFRTVASVVMLAILLPRIDVRSVIPEWRATTPLWLVAAILVTGVAIVLAAVRWQAVLLALGLHARLRTLTHHYLAGLFVGNFLPSTIGGDILRVRRLSAENGAGADTFASVILERLSGMLVLPLITLTALAANPGLRQLGTASALAAALSVGTLCMLSVVLYTVSHPGLGRRFTGTSGWQSFAGAVHLGAARFRRHPGEVVGVLVACVAYQLTMVVAGFLAARVIGIDEVGITAALAFIPAVAVAQTVPISLGGLGVREGAFAVFLHPLGVSTGNAVALGLLIYGLNLTVSLLGAPSFAVGGRRAADVAP